MIANLAPNEEQKKRKNPSNFAIHEPIYIYICSANEQERWNEKKKRLQHRLESGSKLQHLKKGNIEELLLRNHSWDTRCFEIVFHSVFIFYWRCNKRSQQLWPPRNQVFEQTIIRI